ncbi:hypothetical protein L1887_51850 [Cichorium endivia]|nr:hypothetical protein L1887_51850 [Cichorium endivia]
MKCGVGRKRRVTTLAIKKKMCSEMGLLLCKSVRDVKAVSDEPTAFRDVDGGPDCTRTGKCRPAGHRMCRRALLRMHAFGWGRSFGRPHGSTADGWLGGASGRESVGPRIHECRPGRDEAVANVMPALQAKCALVPPPSPPAGSMKRYKTPRASSLGPRATDEAAQLCPQNDEVRTPLSGPDPGPHRPHVWLAAADFRLARRAPRGGAAQAQRRPHGALQARAAACAPRRPSRLVGPRSQRKNGVQGAGPRLERRAWRRARKLFTCESGQNVSADEANDTHPFALCAEGSGTGERGAAGSLALVVARLGRVLHVVLATRASPGSWLLSSRPRQSAAAAAYPWRSSSSCRPSAIRRRIGWSVSRRTRSRTGPQLCGRFVGWFGHVARAIDLLFFKDLGVGGVRPAQAARRGHRL